MAFITDRVPTEKDANRNGHVIVPLLNGGHQRAYQHYAFVKLGNPWWSPKDLVADSITTKRYPV